MSRGRDLLRAAAVVGTVAGVTAAVRLRAFYRDLDVVTGHDDVLSAETCDGWRIALYRYAARGVPRPFPVVMGHGFAGSRLIWDLTPETSLARYLAHAGYDVYTVDLRGRGDSWPSIGSQGDAHWSFDDVVEHDLPTAVAAACRRSGAEQGFWIGQEMSGQALYASAISGTATQVRGGVTLGAPVLTPRSAMVPGVTTQPRIRSHGRVRFRPGAHAAGPLLALARSRQLESSFRPRNTDPLVAARYLYNGVPDESTVLADQFRDWIDRGVMRSVDHRTVWSDRVHDVTMPLLIMAAAHDLQRPPESIRATFEAVGSGDRTWMEAGVTSGFSVDFGHDDLVTGRASRAEVFPRIRAWLDDRCDDRNEEDRDDG